MSTKIASTASVRLKRRRVRWFFAGLLVAIGAIDVVQALLVHRPLRDRTLETLLPTGVTEGSRTAVVISGLALLLLARGMAKGKRVAWLLTCLVLGASAALDLIRTSTSSRLSSRHGCCSGSGGCSRTSRPASTGRG